MGITAVAGAHQFWGFGYFELVLRVGDVSSGRFYLSSVLTGDRPAGFV